ncbi:DinB family protein [Hoyosella sp. YIM 151337]|uniref:DinB family protein n=1 Tax=Hoyosella sp. YIM 151337 TaxID=2992742 RepID=UPI002236A3D7|nr:DinB family protein [Hoyosella sp. YIM 151337]MCW4354395.1 DinB family protein [Hoyosella sp. YIM 151337]
MPAAQQTVVSSRLEAERAELLEALAMQRHFLRYTVRDLTDDQARQRTTVSELCLGGLVKHVAATERGWVDFILQGPSALGNADEVDYEARANEFRLLDGETLEGILNEYDEVAARTAAVIAELPNLDVSHPLPDAPWFPPGVTWSARRVLVHILAETAQHAGHADILRESLDGSKTMG